MRTASARPAAFWALAYAAFVVYGSLVPLDFKPYPLERAWVDFQHAPFLRLGVESRADWVANGVLYAPLGWLFARAGTACGWRAAWAASLAWVAGSALAVGVEFAQLFFPPRTVSQNDIVAELIGTALGALATPVFAGWADRLAQAWSAGGARLATRLLQGYAVAYVALSFFPYDLLLSGAEVAAKAASDHWAWWHVDGGRGAVVDVLLLVAEAALALPIGVALARRQAGPMLPLAAAIAGAGFGLAIEVGQFFIASGVSQGASVLTRAAGVGLGAWLAPRLHGAGAAGVRRALGRVALPAAAVYLPLLAAAAGLLRPGWRGAEGALAAWQEMRWLPFYYHYYTTEAAAVASVGGVALLYLPAAVLGWARGWRPPSTLAAVALLAAAVEGGKLFVAGLHPDPTNVGVAVAAAALTLKLLDVAERSPTVVIGVAGGVVDSAPGAMGRAPDAAAPAGTAAAAGASRRASPAWLLALPFAAAGAAGFPVFAVALCALLAASAAVVWRWPVLALALLPAALPSLDLAPWSGHSGFGEWDLLAAVCLAVALARTPVAAGRAAAAPPRWLVAAAGLLAASLALSTLRALWPPASWSGAGGWSASTGPWRALPIAAGALWAGLYLLLWERLAAAGHAVAARRSWCCGMLAGLALAVAAVGWERAAFVASMWDFDAPFRATGAISAMRTGGAFIECWLAAASACAAWAALTARRWPARLASVLLLAAAAYAVLVTYSRNGYAAYAAAVALACVLALAHRSAADRRQARALAALTAVAVVGVVAAAALVVLQPGGYARQRLARSTPDLALRGVHWADGLRLRDDGIAASLLGMGVGRYPALHYWRSREAVHAGSHALGREGDDDMLTLGAGATLYVQQIVARPAAGEALTVSGLLRAHAGADGLALSLCEKWILTSLRCVGADWRAAAPASPALPADTWQPAQAALAAPWLARASGWRALLQPPLTLALHTPARGAVDVARLRLETPAGDQRLANGDFARGMDRWFVATDVDPPWQLHSLPLAVLFDQGWLGVAAWGLLLGGALVAGTRAAAAGRAAVPAALPALVAFVVSGSVNTLIDAPRFLFLLVVLAWSSARRESPAAPAN